MTLVDSAGQVPVRRLQRGVALHRDRRWHLVWRREISRVDPFESTERRLEVLVVVGGNAFGLFRRSRLQIIVVVVVVAVLCVDDFFRRYRLQELLLFVVASFGDLADADAVVVVVVDAEIDADGHRDLVLGAFASTQDDVLLTQLVLLSVVKQIDVALEPPPAEQSVLTKLFVDRLLVMQRRNWWQWSLLNGP